MTEKKENHNCPTCGKFMKKYGYCGMKYKCKDVWYDDYMGGWEHD